MLLPKINKNVPDNFSEKIGVAAWAAQTIGLLLVHFVATGLFVLGAVFLVQSAWMTGFWLITILAIVFIGCSIMGIAAIVIDVCNIIYLIKEIRNK